MTDADLLSLWEVFDANADGVLDRDELPSMYGGDLAGQSQWVPGHHTRHRQGGKAAKPKDEG